MPGVSTLACLLAAVIHEAGHFSGMLLCRARGKLDFKAGGMEISVKSYKKSSCKFSIALSGSLFNFITALLIYPLSMKTEFCHSLIFSSITLGVFNLMPVKGLDGGEITEIILEKFLLPDTAYIINKAISFTFILLLWAVSLYLLLVTNDNLTLFAVSASLFLSNCKE